MEKLLDIVFEDADLLVINKPAGLVCHPTKSGEHSSLIGRLRTHCQGQCKPHLVNRLDRETSGVMVVAKQDAAAKSLRLLWETRSVRKQYLAIVHGHLKEEALVIDAAIGKDDRSEVAIRDWVRPDGAAAKTEVRLVRRFEREEGPFSLVGVSPHTGRKHQIRIHLSCVGHPIVGDKLYGQDERLYLSFVKGCLTEAQRRQLVLCFHALHAQELEFHWNGGKALFRAEPEAWFRDFCGVSRSASINE